MMLLSGVENEYIKYCEVKTNNVWCYYADRMKQLKPHTMAHYYQPKGVLEKNKVVHSLDHNL